VTTAKNSLARILAGAGFLLFTACAQIGPPPGGEVDKVGPVLLRSEPSNGAVNVAAQNSVIIYFSKDINPPVGAQGLFVSPRPTEKMKIKWKSDHVVITLPEPFKSGQTYVVTIPSGLTDLHNNKMDSSISVAFSTGPVLDSGRVAGYVYQESNPMPGVTTALYDLATFKDSVPYDSVYPDYITMTGKAGDFVFRNLPPKAFRLIAFVDKNRDGRFSPARESFAVPDRPIKVGEGLLDNLVLGMTTYDTTRPEMIAATLTQDHLLRLRFSKKIALERLKTDPMSLAVRLHSDTTVTYNSLGFAQSTDEESSILDFWCGDIKEGVYKVELGYDKDRPPLIFDSLKVAPVPDKAPPLITGWLPFSVPLFVRDVKVALYFSEPIDTTKFTAQTFLLWEGKDTRLSMAHSWEDPFHLNFKPDKLRDGASYRLQVTEFDITDRAGNKLGDTLREYKFATLNVDSLGSISGEIAVKLPSAQAAPVVLSFNNIGSRQKYGMTATGQSFRIDVPAGKYLLSGFTDSNRNGKRDLGSIIPYGYAETAASFRDTIVVRARFETAGINFEIK
jgi:hypothetical protein